MSSTADKALELLSHFSRTQPEIGLSAMARLAGIDKATAHRMLMVLGKHGLVEQDARSKRYRLGAGTLRLASVREACFPIAAVAGPVLHDLAEKTGETTHASLMAGGSMATIGMVPGKRAIHVSLDAGESLPFHATASGIACLAFLPDEQVAALLKRRLPSFTAHTLTTSADVMKAVGLARTRGYAVADQSYEADVLGIAAPLFGANGTACGAVAVATPAHRMTRDIKAHTLRCVLEAAVEMTRRIGAEPPSHFMALLRKAAA